MSNPQVPAQPAQQQVRPQTSSKSIRASTAMLLIPLILIIVIVILSVLVVMRFTKPASNNSSTQVKTQQENLVDTSNNQTNTQGTTNKQESKNPLDKAMNAVPERGFPQNTCPQALTEEGSDRSFALDSDRKYLLTPTDVSWIKANCSDTEFLNF